MKKRISSRKPTRNKDRRPAVLVRFYPEDMQLVNAEAGRLCTPRESFIRRCVLKVIRTGESLIADTPPTISPDIQPLLTFEEPAFDTPTEKGRLRKIKATPMRKGPERVKKLRNATAKKSKAKVPNEVE